MDLAPLSAVVTADGPFATVLLDASQDTEDGARLVELRWRDLRKELEGDGADAATLEALDAAVGAAGVPGRHGQALVAARGRVLLDEVLPEPPRQPVARWSPLPHLMPILAQRPPRIPHVVVVADRIGADIQVSGPGLDDELSVEGEEHPVHKVPSGGWSHRRFQERAENLWERNATLVAQRVDDLVRRTGARLVVAAGDEHAVSALREHLSERARELLVTVEEGARAAGSEDSPLAEKVQRLLAQLQAEDEAAVIDTFERERGQHDRAVEGFTDTVQAIARAQVETLLLVDDPSSTFTLWTGEDPLVIGTSREEVTALGAQAPVEDRADAVLVRALTASDAALVTVPAERVGLRDGIGAVLRWADASTPA